MPISVVMGLVKEKFPPQPLAGIIPLILAELRAAPFSGPRRDALAVLQLELLDGVLTTVAVLPPVESFLRELLMHKQMQIPAEGFRAVVAGHGLRVDLPRRFRKRARPECRGLDFAHKLNYRHLMARNHRTGAQALKAWLKEHDVTQVAFGEQIGVSAVSVYLYVSGRATPGEAMKLAIHKATRGKVPVSLWPVYDARRRSAANG